MWDDFTTAPAPTSSGSALEDLFARITGAVGTKIEQELVRDNVQQTLGANPALYGVDEYGRVYLKGEASFASARIAGVPAPLVLVGVGILAVAFLLHSKG